MQIIDRLIVTVQKARSNEREYLERSGHGAVADTILEDSMPWLHGKKSILKGLIGVQERGSVTGQEFYNFMVIANQFEPSIAALHLMLNDGEKLPGATLSPLKFEPE